MQLQVENIFWFLSQFKKRKEISLIHSLLIKIIKIHKLINGRNCFPENQFFRCLWSALGLQMDAKDAEVLKQKYMRNDGSVNYMQFCNEIDLNFNPNNLKKNPKDQTVEVPEL